MSIRASYGTISSVDTPRKVESIEAQLADQTSHVDTIASATKKMSHINRNDLIRDVIIGFADGLTVPFALTAGLSAIGSTRLVIIGGLAELFAGAISMGLGAWLAATTERNACMIEEQKQHALYRERSNADSAEVCELFDQYGVSSNCVEPLVSELRQDPSSWVQFKLDVVFRLSKPSRLAAFFSALAMGFSYFIGGLIPMIPYFVTSSDVNQALWHSIGVTIVVLLAFGYVKAAVTGAKRKAAVASAVQTLVVGTLAAGASYGIVRGVNSSFGGQDELKD